MACLLCQITDLLINITKHLLRPKHRVLTDQEKQKLLKKYSIEVKQVSLFLLGYVVSYLERKELFQLACAQAVFGEWKRK